MMQIREEFVGLHGQLFDNFYGNILNRRKCDAKESFEKHHTAEMAVMNTKLLQATRDKIVLKDENIKLRDQLEKKANEIQESVDKLEGENTFIRNRIGILSHESTAAREKFKSAEADKLRLTGRAISLERALNTSNIHRDDLILANSNFSRHIECLNRERVAREVLLLNTTKAFMNQAHHDLISVRAKLVEANKGRLGLEEKDKKRQGEMLELRRMMQIAIATVRTGVERFGRENAVQKIENTDKKVPLARSEQIWFVKNTKHKRDLNDRQQTRSNVDLQSLASSAIKELKDTPTQSILPADNISRSSHSQSPAGCVENTCIPPKLFKDFSPPLAPLAPAPVPLASALASTPAMVIYRRFDIDH